MKLPIISLVLIISSNVFCQEKTIFIKDSISQEPVVFAAIQFIDKIGGIYADEIGRAIIPDSVKEILISQIAYEKKTLNMQYINNNSDVVIAPIFKILPEVIISNISLKKKEIGCLKKKKSNGLIAAPNTNFALFIPYDSTWTSQPYILSIVSYLLDIKKTSKSPFEKCTIRLDLRLPDEDGAPSDLSILNDRIINSSQKKYSGKETFKLSVPVLFPKKGVFIVIDFITPNNSNPRFLINPTLDVTFSGNRPCTWSKTITNDFCWRKMDEHDSAWSSTIKLFFGENATTMNLRGGLQIVF